MMLPPSLPIALPIVSSSSSPSPLVIPPFLPSSRADCLCAVTAHREIGDAW